MIKIQNFTKNYNELQFGTRVRPPVNMSKGIIAQIKSGEISAGFVPTPSSVVSLMLDEIGEIKQSDRILEPSAGYGHIADEICAKTVLCPYQIDVVEPVDSLRKILHEKGYNLVDYNITNYKPKFQYDKIIMNPPFENSLDIIHTCYCFDNLLKQGGILATILPENFFSGNKKDAPDWFMQSDLKKYYEHLEEILKNNNSKTIKLGRAFLNSDVPDDVKTRIVLIKKQN